MAETVAGRTEAEARALFSRFRDMARTGACRGRAMRRSERLRPLAGVHEYPSRVKCATLAWHALLAALDGEGEASSE